jgi:biopolymer transport protein ExbB/TolQ
MSNIRYAVLIIGALSLLLGLSLGQIYYQHQRIEQLEFNRFQQSGEIKIHHRQHNFCRENHFHDAQRALERARADVHRKFERKQRVEEVERRLQEAIYRYNRELDKWESNPKWESTKNGLYRFED